MRNRARTGIRRKRPDTEPARAERATPVAPSAESQADPGAALWRIKKDGGARANAGDFQALQRSLGNKGVAQALQRFGRHGAVQALHDRGLVQRHSIPADREAVGEEDDEIGVQRFVQRQPAFGRPQARRRGHGPWGNGRPVAVQRKNGKGGGAGVKDPAGAKGAGKLGAKEDEASKKVAEAEYKDYVGGGPYRINNYEADTADHYGKFDAIYNPGKRSLVADMRVKFTFPDSPVPDKAETIDEVINKLQIQATHMTYILNFITQVQAGWSGRFSFRNARAPQSIWGKLNPIAVTVRVMPVETNQHYILKGYLKKTGRANVRSNTAKKDPSTTTLFKGDLDPTTQPNSGVNDPGVGADELTRLQRNLPKIRFAPGSAKVEAKYIPDLRYAADYLRRMNRPKFDIAIVGRASKTGKEPANVVISQARADAVAAKLKDFGVTNHTVKATGAGSTGATAHGKWRKVDFAPGLVKGFTNMQDTTVHEFGHMLGLDDEYVRDATDTRTNTTQLDMMKKMLGEPAYGKGKEGKYADEVTKVDPLTSASVMERGNEVRSYHYVTLWQALYDTAASGSKQPSPPFTFADWKING